MEELKTREVVINGNKTTMKLTDSHYERLTAAEKARTDQEEANNTAQEELQAEREDAAQKAVTESSTNKKRSTASNK